MYFKIFSYFGNSFKTHVGYRSACWRRNSASHELRQQLLKKAVAALIQTKHKWCNLKHKSTMSLHEIIEPDRDLPILRHLATPKKRFTKNTHNMFKMRYWTTKDYLMASVSRAEKNKGWWWWHHHQNPTWTVSRWPDKGRDPTPTPKAAHSRATVYYTGCIQHSYSTSNCKVHPKEIGFVLSKYLGLFLSAIQCKDQ